MIKRIGIIACASIATALTLSTFAVSSASALPAAGCYLISEFTITAPKQAGNYTNSACSVLTTNTLEGRWESVTPTAHMTENLWCGVRLAGIRLSGSFTTNTCATKSTMNTEFVAVIITQLPNVLPEGTAEKPVTATTKNGTSTFGNGILELTSPKALGSQSGNSAKLGRFTTTFEGVENRLTSIKCTGLSNATEGQVTVNGTFHIRDYNNSAGELKTASIQLLAPVHFECGSILVVVSGCVAGALTPENLLTKTLTLTIAKTGSDNTIITVLNEEDTTKELCQLLAKEGTGATKLSAQTQTVEIELFKQSGAIEVLVMPL